jgi:hypothetical protein
MCSLRQAKGRHCCCSVRRSVAGGQRSRDLHCEEHATFAAAIAVNLSDDPQQPNYSELHLAAVTDNGSLFTELFSIPDGISAGVDRVEPAGSFHSVALASSVTLGQSLGNVRVTLATTGADGRVYRSRGRNGNWPSFSLVDSAPAAGELSGDVIDVAVTNSAGTSHFVAVTGDGHIWLASRFPNDTWNPWFDLEVASFVGPTHDVGTFDSASAAATTEGLHVLGTTTNGQLWHQLRSQFDPQFRDVEIVGVQQDVGLFTAVDCASTPTG